MELYDVSANRTFTLQLHRRANFDGQWTFYYDETNNLKKFYVKESGFNSTFQSNFVLGGLVFQDQDNNLDQLFSGLKLQGNIQDVKLKHLAHGKFSECINSQKLNYFLEYLFDKKINVHFHWVNLLYWSTADIVDSCIMNSEVAMKVADVMHRKVKDDFYMLVKMEINAFIDLFYRYGYPNIKKEKVVPFLEELEELFYPYIYDRELHFGLESLRQILEESKDKKELPFLSNEEDHMLLEEFGQFYVDPVGLFKNSQHIFDNEETVREKMSKLKIVDGDMEIKNYTFVDSRNSRPIQASDIYIGLMGKLSTFINTSTKKNILKEITTWSEIQKRNVFLLMRLMNDSDKVNPAFIHSIDSSWEKDKAGLICDELAAW